MGEAKSSGVKLIQLDLKSYLSCDEIGFMPRFPQGALTSNEYHE